MDSKKPGVTFKCNTPCGGDINLKTGLCKKCGEVRISGNVNIEINEDEGSVRIGN